MFFDILFSLISAIIISMLLLGAIANLLYHYTLHKDSLIADEIINTIIIKNELPGSKKSDTRVINKKNFFIDYSTNKIAHSKFYSANEIPILSITISWMTYFNTIHTITRKIIYEKI